MIITVKQVGSFFAFDKATGGFSHKMVINIVFIDFLTAMALETMRHRDAFRLIL